MGIVNAIDFLLSPAGQELTHAVVLLVATIATLFAARAKQITEQNAKKLDGHLEEHVMGIAHTTSGVTEHPSDDM